jgi:hypothetical protein
MGVPVRLTSYQCVKFAKVPQSVDQSGFGVLQATDLQH